MVRLVTLTALALVAAPAMADPVAPATKGQPTDPNQRVKCVREEVTGSLASRRRVCMTVAQWQQRADRAYADAANFADRGRICTGNSCSGGQ